MNGVVIEERYVKNQFEMDDFLSALADLQFLFCLFLLLPHSVVIENCVLCDNAIVRKGCNLKNCLIGSNHEVAENTIKEKAHLTNSDGYMEIE